MATSMALGRRMDNSRAVLVRRVGFDPTTNGLKVRCSTE